jgi:hypothetical protein
MRLSRHASIQDGAPPPWPAWVPLTARRRLDALNRLACATTEALLQQGARLTLHPDTAVIVANSYGSVDSTLRFIGSINEHGDHNASPTPFTTSVHNSSAGVLGELLGLHGPSTTISQGGTGGLAALRWAHLMLAAGRAPAVLVVVGDRHVSWSRDIVSRLSGSPWPIGDGAAACLLEAAGAAGRELRLGRHPAERCLDGGALLVEDEGILAERALGQERVRAPDALGSWWPCCTLAALDLADPRALQLREIEHQQLLEVWLGPRPAVVAPAA